MSEPCQEIRNVQQLNEFVRSGGRPEYVLFWGHTPKTPDEVEKSCLSNWFDAGFVLDGLWYHTVEHYMMAEKARLFEDDASRERILVSKTPREAKALGRKVAGFDEDVWSQHRFDIVVRANLEKFTQNPQLGAFLLNTAPKVLVEASPYDRVWGIGLNDNDADVLNPRRWKGWNLLGFALMEVRGRLVPTREN